MDVSAAKTMQRLLSGASDAAIRFDWLCVLIRLWVETAEEFGDPVPKPKGRGFSLGQRSAWQKTPGLPRTMRR
jgi:hypothetical protein